jgi:hypothetical protein
LLVKDLKSDFFSVTIDVRPSVPLRVLKYEDFSVNPEGKDSDPLRDLKRARLRERLEA